MGWLDLVSPDRGQSGGLLGSYAAPAQQPGLLPGFAPASGPGNYQNAWLGYLAGALQGGNLGQSIGRGLEGWMQGSQLDQSQRAQQQRLAASTRPAFGVIGEDGRGRKIYGFIEPGQRTVTPVLPSPANAPSLTLPRLRGRDGRGVTGTAPAVVGSPAGLSGASPSAPLHPAIAAAVQQMVEGRLPPPTVSQLSDPSWQYLLGQAAKHQPGFNLARWRAEALNNASRDRDAASGER